jgi:hypothetical protein
MRSNASDILGCGPNADIDCWCNAVANAMANVSHTPFKRLESAPTALARSVIKLSQGRCPLYGVACTMAANWRNAKTSPSPSLSSQQS